MEVNVDGASPASLALETVTSDPMLPIEVHVAKYVSSPVVVPDDDALAHKRQTIWHNGARNRALADIAQAMSRRDHETNWKYGLFLNDAGRLVLDSLPQTPMLTVVVESPEHAGVLAGLLPEFAVCTKQPAPVAQNKLNAWRTGSIMTQVAADLEHGLRSDVIINAVGGPHALSVSKWGLSWHRTTLVIDVLDEIDGLNRRNTLARMMKYHRMAARVTGADSVDGMDPAERHAVPTKDRQQRLFERHDGTAHNRNAKRLERFRSWRGK